ncbi:exoglucanase B-like [Diorhabda carinulata]|uniref:exoglucanase B-like n=1 Tax=Diorhabda carinulata TaxID=1163345 RepID=UPI0025A1A6FE|nr:exoglucanase B-like [Diorhabda carinulata]XP_057660922.1 exoglucanase B-like [Diorhabda carinulata]XP_057660923.1 exoglucanase B-like [Diorhabda carinulata]
MRAALIFFLLGYFTRNSLAGVYTDRFLAQYNKIHDANNGYFSPQGIPYHSVETLIVEAPDHGHETTSEAYSYYVWLEAVYGKVTGDFSKFNQAWENLEKYIIPVTASQPTNSFYNPSHPATYAAELDDPSQYPSQIDASVPVGQDPIFQELVNAYGTSDVYIMHWLLDVDNVYGFGNIPGSCNLGPDAGGPSYINTFQRGPMESVWRTIPQPTCDDFKYGGPNGFLDLFTKDNSYAQQWKYTAAPDADARAIQAAYWASQWAQEVGQLGTIQNTLTKASKMGDYLRYALFDKYFKQIGFCESPATCPGGYGKSSAHYLLGWYFAWGGALATSNGWAWRIGDGTAHFGYQNPLTAWILSNDNNFKPRGATAVSDWATSLDRQLELYEWLQTAEGAFAGGVTNTINGRYDPAPSELKTNTFHGMFYDWEPVYHNPPSNKWYGMQPWSVDRLAQYYYVTGDARAKAILDKWVTWILSNISIQGTQSYTLPADLSWSGNPPNVHVTVDSYNSDVGTASATARTLAYYAAKANHAQAKQVAKSLLDIMWTNYQTTKGVSAPEAATTYTQFNEPVYVPPGWNGKYPRGDVIQNGATFIGIRSWYKNDPEWSKVEAYLNGGQAPTFTFHRFWSQADVAISQAVYGILFNE